MYQNNSMKLGWRPMSQASCQQSPLSHIHYIAHYCFTTKVIFLWGAHYKKCELVMQPSIACWNLFQCNWKVWYQISSSFLTFFPNFQKIQDLSFRFIQHFHADESLMRSLLDSTAFITGSFLLLKTLDFSFLYSAEDTNHKTYDLTWVCWVKLNSPAPAGLTQSSAREADIYYRSYQQRGFCCR